MTVFKKSALLVSFLILIAFATFAQNTESKESKTARAESDPVEFVQNYLISTVTPELKATDLQAANSKLNQTGKKSESFGDGVLNWVKDKYATVLQVLPNQISNVMLYRFIDEWYGVRYRMGGTNKSGIDCSAFVQTLYKYVFGFNLLRTACLQFQETKFITDMNDLKEGDLVFFRINTSRISHVGVYLKNNFFVHSASSKGVSIANLNQEYWSKYFVGGGRVLN